MPFSNKNPNQITETDLRALIGAETESKFLDYKRDIVGNGDGDRKEFLYDISSFANTQGGYLVFGIEEAKGLPTRIVGLGGLNVDKEMLRLQQIARDGIRPPITGIEYGIVRVAGGEAVIVLRVPKSWSPPHQVTYQKAFRFYARDSNGKYPIDIDELRSIFSLSATVADKIKEFRAERLTRVAAADAPVPLLDGGLLAIHVMPFSAVSVVSSFSIQQAAQQPQLFPPIGSTHPQHYQITFDGLLVTSNAEAPPKAQRAYTHIFRTGAVEAVASSILRSDGAMMVPHLQALIVRYAGVYMRALRELGVEPPIAVLASFVGVKDARMLHDFLGQGALMVDVPQNTLTRQSYNLVESIFEQIPQDDAARAKGLRATLDHLANAAGLATSPYFDENGNYTLKL
jgi:hypothetical protein